MNQLWQQAVADVTLEQVNHHERYGVLPIAFSLSHAMRGQDRTIHRYFLDQGPLWEREPWAERVGVSVDKMGSGVPVAEMEHLSFRSLDAWRDYQTQVIETTDRVLEILDAPTLDEIIVDSLPTGRSFLVLMYGAGQPVRKRDALEGWVYQHGLRHLGELEHARSLVGLGGLTG
jgi:hypothetical protein